MQFIRDLLVPRWYSKFNVLARMCASSDRRSCWYDAGCSDMVAVQCGDGRVLAPVGAAERPHYLILHDWDEKYAPMVRNAVRVVTLGRFAGVPRGASILESFPVPEFPHRPVHPDNNILVAGDCSMPGTFDFIEEVMGGLDRELSVTVALYDGGSSGTERFISGLVYGETMSSFKKVQWRKRQSYPMITALYTTAGLIVHSGAGTRGFLHSLAVMSASRGAGLITRTGDNGFIPATIGELIGAIGEK